MKLKALLTVFLLLWTVVGHAEPPVTGVLYPDFSDIADLALREGVLQLPQVDVEKYPSLKPLLADTIALVQKLTIPEDGNRPIRVVFVDDMSPSMGFARTTKGPHILKINLGALHFFNDDSELAYMIGHELEHSLSRLNEEARQQSTAARGKYFAELKASLVHRVGENEVDVKSVFRRVHKKGYSPYAAIDLMERLIEMAGDQAGLSHTKLTNRRNTIELELVGMSRLLGERRNRVIRNEILKPVVKEFFRSQEFLAARIKEAQTVATGYDRLAEEFALAVKDIETAPTAEQQKAKEAIANEKLAQIYARYQRGTQLLEHHLSTTAPQAVLLDEQLKLRAAVARALRLAQEKYFPNIDSFKVSRQYTLLRKAVLLSFKSQISVEYQRGPLESLLGKIDRAKREIAKLGTNAEARSRRFTLDRDLKKYNLELELMLSGYDDPTKVVAETRKAADFLDNFGAGLIPEEYFKQHGAIDYLQKHIGPELKAREQWLLQQSKHISRLYLSDPNFDPEQLMETLRDLSKKDQQEAFPKLLSSYLKTFQNKLRNAKTDEEYQKVANQAKKIFAYSYGHNWDLRDEVTTNPSSAVPVVRDYLRTLIQSAPSAKALSAVSPAIEKSGNEKTVMLGAFPERNEDTPIQMNTLGAALVYDSEMMGLELARRLTQFEETLKNQYSKSLPDFLAQASELFKASDARIHLLTPRAQRNFQKARMNLVLKMAEETVPPKIRATIPNWREVIRAATRIRLFESPQDLTATEIKEMLGTIEKSFPLWEADDETAKFLGRALNMDGWLVFHEKAKSAADGFQTIVRHPTPFLNGFTLLGHDSELQLGNREGLLEFLWYTEKVRDKRLAPLHQLLNFPSFKNDSSYEKLGKLYIDELWREATPKPKTLQEFEKFVEPILRNVPSALPSIASVAIAKRYKLSDAQIINLAEAHRQADLKTRIRNDPDTINHHHSEQAKSAFRDLGISDRLDALPILERTRHLILTTIEKTGPEGDVELDNVLKLAAADPEAKKLLMDPKIVGNFYYEVTRRNFALWQLQQQFQLDSIESHLKSGKLPTIQQRRQIVGDIQKWVDEQFPRNQPLKDTVLNAVEDKILTSPAESQQLASSRLSFANWERLPEIVLVDLPEIINGSIESSYDRLQLIEYFTGRRDTVPDFVIRAEKRGKGGFQNVSALKVAQDLRVRFVSSPLPVRTAMLQTLLDQDFGILAEPETEMGLKQLMLGKNFDNQLFRTLFETYLDSLPKAERKPVYGSIVASMADAPKGSRGVSLKVVLEAMGPFGIKAGQFLRTSGLISEELAADLDGFLDRALPPDRSRIANDLQKRFGDNIEGFQIVRNLVGSGSINYVVRVDFKKPLDGETSAVVRIRRPKVEGQVYNENELWATVARRIRSEDPEVAEVIEEARGHTYETLREGGSELDLSIEVRNEPIAQKSYNRKINSGPARGFEVSVGHPLQGFQKLLLPNQESETAIYRFVDATPLDEIKDPTLRAALAAEIVNSELAAVFEKGVFDPDGHPGNWLIDLKNKRLVRIDYAQLRTLGERNEEFRKVFKELISGRPNFRSPDAAKALAQLLRAEGISSDQLEKAIVKVATSTRFSKSRVPQTQLFDLRRALRKELGVNISSSDELRAGMAAIAKMRGFSRYLPKGDFEILVAKYAKLPIAKPLMWLKAIKDWAQGEKRIPATREKELAPATDPLRPETRRALENLSEVTELSPAKSFRAGNHQTAAAAAPVLTQKEYIFKLGSIHWSPSSREEVHLLTPDEFEKLPLGTVVYSIFDKLERIKGVHEMDLETRFGKTGWGLRGAEAEDFGGFRVVPIQLTPPPTMDLSGNPYYTSQRKVRYTLLTPEQYAALPPDTVLYFADTDEAFLKGNPPAAPTTLHGHLMVGFPDSSQRGFEGHGTDACHKYFEVLGKR